MLKRCRRVTKQIVGLGLCVTMTYSVPLLALGAEPAENQGSACAILLSHNSEVIPNPSDIPHSRYFEVMCDMLLDLIFHNNMEASELHAQQMGLEQELAQEKEPPSEDSLLRLKVKENELLQTLNKLHQKHYKNLTNLIKIAITTNRLSEEAFWSKWSEEKKRYRAASNLLKEHYIDVSRRLIDREVEIIKYERKIDELMGKFLEQMRELRQGKGKADQD